MRTASGGLIDRNTRLRFRFDGRDYLGFAGDTLASALLANNIKLVGRSFKYHRPRGILTAGPEEPNALVELRHGARREPNTKATTVELYDGLEAVSQNRWPSLGWDVSAANGFAAPFLHAGFYYKTFMWPESFWEKVYEPLIRRAAGLGRASAEPDPDIYEKAYAFCDVLVVGAGPAGLTAALAAARSGARVMLCEQDFALGGRLLSENFEIRGMSGPAWAREIEAELRAFPDVVLMPRTSVFGAYDGDYAALEHVADHLPIPPPFVPRQRLWKIVPRHIVITTGAVERIIAFNGNDRPGVMTASAVRTYLNRFGTAPGNQPAIFTTTDDGWRTIADLSAAGVRAVAVIDPRSDVPKALVARAEDSGARVFLGAEVQQVRGTHGVRNITVSQGDASVTVACDALGVSGGWNPAFGISSHLGSKPLWSDTISGFIPGELPRAMTVAGAAAGKMTLQEALADGAAAGQTAAANTGFKPSLMDIPQASDEPAGMRPFWRSKTSRRFAFVDFQNDVTDKDVVLAAQEGFRNLEHLKRYTTLGMATDQGKTGAVVGQAVMAALSSRAMSDIGVPRARPPEIPVAIAAFAGHHRGKDFRPYRRTAGHRWAEEQRAVFTEAGQWLRAQWFPREGEKDWLETVSREAATVRNAVGVCDVSTLGKIDIQGSDAGIFLDRIYINTFSTLPVGKARYGVMLREDGFVMDDGTTSRLAADHYFMTTTTANAARVMQHLEFCHQVLWPDLDVQMVSVTEQWSQYAIAGPRSRELLRKIVDENFNIENTDFPFLAASPITVCGGLRARLFRISFSGELAYELAVPARYGDSLIRTIMEAGAPLGIAPYGTEALSVLRIEKGHAAGNELNGQTTANDLGLGRMMSAKKDYIGRVLAGRPALIDPNRPALTGFKPVDPKQRLRAGAHLFAASAIISPDSDEGHMTSVAFSPALGCWIGLGLLKRGPSRWGDIIRAYDPVRGGDLLVEVCSPVFVDPQGTQLHV